MKYSSLSLSKITQNLKRLILISFLCGSWCSFAVAGNENDKLSAPPPRPVARLVTSIDTPRRAPVNASASSNVAAATSTTVAIMPAITSALASVERRAFDLINAERIAAGETPFVWDAELNRMARIHSDKMARQDFFDHIGPDGLDTVARAHACAITGWGALGENIAYNQGFDDPAAFAVERWMHSTKHRTNILNAQFSRSGLGVARAADGRIFFTQVFTAR